MFNVPFLKPQCKRASHAPLQISGHAIFVLVGLGNPGDTYKATYHNVGHLFLDSLVRAQASKTRRRPAWENRKLFHYTYLDGVALAKTGTLMNTSGKALKAILHCFRVKPEEILLVHDDADIELGRYKLSSGRGSAGHKGVESVANAVELDKVLRLRIGIRTREGKAGDFVLTHIPAERLAVLEKTFREIQEKLVRV